MAAMDDDEWEWLMYHLHKWTQEEWESWLENQSEATQAYYYSWNRRQNDVLVMHEQQMQAGGHVADHPAEPEEEPAPAETGPVGFVHRLVLEGPEE